MSQHKLKSGYIARSLEAEDFQLILDYNWGDLVVERDTIYMLAATIFNELGLIVFNEDSKPIAMLLAFAAPDKKCAFLLKIHVAPKYRRLGIASEMMELFEKKIVSSGIKMIFLFARSVAKSFYQELGYVPESPCLPLFLRKYVNVNKACELLSKTFSGGVRKVRKDGSFREKNIDLGGVDT